MSKLLANHRRRPKAGREAQGSIIIIAARNINYLAAIIYYRGLCFEVSRTTDVFSMFKDRGVIEVIRKLVVAGT